jgi:hypothetical protein
MGEGSGVGWVWNSYRVYRLERGCAWESKVYVRDLVWWVGFGH